VQKLLIKASSAPTLDGIMAPNHSKLAANDGGKRKRPPLAECAMNKIGRGGAVFSDEYVEAMAAGKMKDLPKNLDDIIVSIDSDEEEAIDKELRCSKKLKTCGPLDVQDVLLCPEYAKRNMFAVFDDASYYSDGNVKHHNIKCQGTDSSPCSFCDTPSPSPPKVKKHEFVQAKGFDIADYEGEEDTPKKISGNGNICKWCNWDPCILLEDEVNEEARVIVDNLIAQEKQGIQLTYRNYRYALYRMYARALGYKERQLLPVCVQSYIDKHFAEEDEKQTGFKAK